MPIQTAPFLDGLTDPRPPAADAATRAAVEARAGTLARRRRLGRGGAVLTCALVLTAGVVAFATSGSDGAGSRRVDVATRPETGGASVAPTPGSVRVTIDSSATSGIPAGVMLYATLAGEGGAYSASTRTPGALAFGMVPPGNYELLWEWASDDGTATGVGQLSVAVNAATDATGSLSLRT